LTDWFIKLNHTSASCWTEADRGGWKRYCPVQWSFPKTGTLASQAEIGVWVQAPEALATLHTTAVLGVVAGGDRPSAAGVRGITVGKIFRLYVQNLAV